MGAGSWIHKAGGPACRVVTVSTRSISLALEASIKEEGKKNMLRFSDPFSLLSLIRYLPVIKRLLDRIG